jgi:hypothetical protein
MTQSTVADDEEPDHTFNLVHHHTTSMYSQLYYTIVSTMH